MCAVLHYYVYYLCKMHQNTVLAVLFLCRNLIYSYENPQKLLPPELLLLAQICTKSFVGSGSLQCSPRPPKWFKGVGPRGRREGSRKGEEGMRGEAGHPQIFR